MEPRNESGANPSEADDFFEHNAYTIRLLSILLSLLMHKITLQLFKGGQGEVAILIQWAARLFNYN